MYSCPCWHGAAACSSAPRFPNRPGGPMYLRAGRKRHRIDTEPWKRGGAFHGGMTLSYKKPVENGTPGA